MNRGGISESALVTIVHNRSLETSLRLNACWLLPRLGIEAAEDVLKSLMSDPVEQIREEAATGLGLIPQDDVVEILINAVEHDGYKSVRLAALHSLGVLSSPQSATRVMRILQNILEDDEVRADAAEALAHVIDKRIVDLLIESLRDKSSLVRYSAAYALGQQGDDIAIPALREVAFHDKAITQWGSVASCALSSIEVITGHHL